MPSRAPGRDGQLFGPVEGLHFHLGAQARLRHGHPQGRAQVEPVAKERRVLSNPQVEVEISGGAAPGPGGTSPRQAQSRAIVHARRHIDRVRVLFHPSALATAVEARRGDLLAGPAAARAWRRGHHLTEKRLAYAAQLADPIACRARDGHRPSARPRAPAGLAGGGGPHGHFALRAENRLGKLHLEQRLDVLASRRARPSCVPGAEGAAAEKGIEYVAQTATGEACKRVRARVRRPARTCRTAAAAPGLSRSRRRGLRA